MAAARTLIASSLLVILLGSAFAPSRIRVAPAAGTEAPPALASASMATDLQPREIPDRLRPWFADYPATTDIEGARVFAATTDQVAAARDALDRFASAGLELPEVEFWMHADSTGCVADDFKVRAGYLINRAGTWAIFNCGLEFTLLHELAHVWDNHALDDATRSAFMELRQADAWSGVEWHRAGGEHLADVLAWGLGGGEVRPSRTMPNDDSSLAEAFQVVTGIDPASVVG